MDLVCLLPAAGWETLSTPAPLIAGGSDFAAEGVELVAAAGSTVDWAMSSRREVAASSLRIVGISN